jgi:hypothetical protein
LLGQQWKSLGTYGNRKEVDQVLELKLLALVVGGSSSLQLLVIYQLTEEYDGSSWGPGGNIPASGKTARSRIRNYKQRHLAFGGACQVLPTYCFN